MATNIIFLCPHNAAKSAIAAAFLTRETCSRGLDVSIATAGTHPDPFVLPIVSERLVTENLPPAQDPRKVTPDDLARADIVVNLGCELNDLPTSKSPIEWQIPNFSDDPVLAFAALEDHVECFAADLANRE